MPLKTLVKVGSISNLSDARYCSGMGVDMLGFRVIKGQENYIEPAVFQEIRGWVSGPSVVAELYGIQSGTPLQDIIENYAPDYLEIHFHDLQYVSANVNLPLIVKVTDVDLTVSFQQIQLIGEKIHYLLLSDTVDEKLIEQVVPLFPVIISLKNISNLHKTMNSLLIKGIALNGSTEIRPGQKDYEDLALVLEQLEVE
jgi:phosphoribosylanthranilate isomerase